MNQTLRQIAIGAAGGVVTLLVVVIWSWIVDGGLVQSIGGLAVRTFGEELKEVREQITEVNQEIREIQAVYPRGAVVVFDRDDLDVDLCPKGWISFKVPGHVIVGAGADSPYRFRDQGGEAKHTLTVGEMPSHEHHVRDFEWGHTVNKDDSQVKPRIDVDDGHPWEDRPGNPLFGRLVTDAKGKGEAHNNMPPYIALYFCKKQ